MKANLEFELPDDEFNYNITINAYKMYSALLDIDDIVRKYSKYVENPNLDDVIAEIRDLLYESQIREME